MEAEEKPESAQPARATTWRRKVGQAGLLFRQSMPSILVWPLVCIALCIALWVTVLGRIAEERRVVEVNALRQTASMTYAYAQHVSRAVEKVDQLTLLIKYEWERSQRGLKLEELMKKGLFPSSQFVLVVIADHNGRPITGTLPIAGNTNFADRDYFIEHRTSGSADLRIGSQEIGRLSRKTVIQFTRRLERADGTFDGVVLIAIEPSYFSAFYKGSNLGEAGFLGLLGPDGKLRMSGIGGAVDPLNASTLRALPPFPEKSGTTMLDGREWFRDDRARFVGWETIQPYSLVALTGLSADALFKSWEQGRTRAYANAAAATAFLVVSALLAFVFSLRIAAARLKEDEVRNAYRIATEGGNEGFYMLRALRDKNSTVIDFEVVDCNVRGATFYGLTREQFVGQRSSTLNTEAHFRIVLETYRNAMELGFYQDELQVPPESPVKIKWIRRKFVRSGTGLAITIRDISDVKAHEQELSRMANEDALTALPNRNWLRHFLPAAIDRAHERNGKLALLFIDLDGFKKVNDSLGHSAGDELLQIAAARLSAVLRHGDRAVRLGGDEFTVILDPLESIADAEHVADRIIQAFNTPFELLRGRDTVGASIGISIFPRDGADAEALLRHSDIAMYHAKAGGKGSFRFYEPAFSASLQSRLATERALQTAIEDDQFVLHYQPRVNASNGNLCGMEALVRWMHPQLGMVPPLEFIALAEETGMILRLGEIVLEQVCAQIAQWKIAGLPLVPVSVNVSPRQFARGDLKHKFSACLERHGLDVTLIEIEITESSMIGDEVAVGSQLTALRRLGITLMVDDFGTGYSSLSQLQRLDMDVLKVDRAFTAELGRTAEGEVFFRAIVSMAHALGMTVVAEGVETTEQLQILQALRCDEIQGYLISRPVPAAEVPALLRQQFRLPEQPVIST